MGRLTLAALADPNRRAILARLAQGEATANELAAHLRGLRTEEGTDDR